jgi:diphosphomevalonate decarboxylase
VVWGKTDHFHQYNNLAAKPVNTAIHPLFQKMNDAILIVNAKTKKTGSSAGHALMETNPYASARYHQAQEHVIELHDVLALGNMDRFIEIVEQEALTLHALMMSSQPGYMLMEGETLAIINLIRQFRNDTKIPLCFTLDAGPNVHLLYPDAYKTEIVDLINRELLLFCTSNYFLDDGIGPGPAKVTYQE